MISEVELALHFINYLEMHGYTTYKEVPVRGGYADIVATDGKINILVEVKMQFSLTVMQQCFEKSQYGHYNYIAVPKTKNDWFRLKICKDLGLGVLYCNILSGIVYEVFKPKLNRKAHELHLLHDYQKFNTAGTKQNGRITPLGFFISNLEDAIKHYNKTNPNGPGLSLKEAFNVIQPRHYSSMSSMRSSLIRGIDKGFINQFEIDGKYIKLKSKS